MVKEILASPVMSGEQGSGFLQEYGGPSMYVEMANYSPGIRQVYYSVQAGASTPGEIEVMTGLSLGEVNSGIDFLVRKGLISQVEVVPESGVE